MLGTLLGWVIVLIGFVLYHTIKIIREDNLRLEKKISEFTEEIKIVDSNINNLKGQKTKIKEIYHEKISNVDKLTVPELDSFFTDRYK